MEKFKNIIDDYNEIFNYKYEEILKEYKENILYKISDEYEKLLKRIELNDEIYLNEIREMDNLIVDKEKRIKELEFERETIIEENKKYKTQIIEITNEMQRSQPRLNNNIKNNPNFGKIDIESYKKTKNYIFTEQRFNKSIYKEYKLIENTLLNYNKYIIHLCSPKLLPNDIYETIECFIDNYGRLYVIKLYNNNSTDCGLIKIEQLNNTNNILPNILIDKIKKIITDGLDLKVIENIMYNMVILSKELL